MALKIRLRQQGRINRRFYRIVVTDSRSPRDGKYVESVGWYNPYEAEQEKCMLVLGDRVQHWLEQGAQMSDGVKSLVEKAAPSITKQQTDKVVAKRAKKQAKRKAGRARRTAARGTAISKTAAKKK